MSRSRRRRAARRCATSDSESAQRAEKRVPSGYFWLFWLLRSTQTRHRPRVVVGNEPRDRRASRPRRFCILGKWSFDYQGRTHITTERTCIWRLLHDCGCGVRGCPLIAGGARRWGAGVYSLINHGIHRSPSKALPSSRLGPIVGIYVDSTLAAACHSVFAYQSRAEFLLMQRESLSGGKRSRGAGRRRSERHTETRHHASTSWCVAPEAQCQPAAHFTRRLYPHRSSLGSTALQNLHDVDGKLD